MNTSPQHSDQSEIGKAERRGIPWPLPKPAKRAAIAAAAAAALGALVATPILMGGAAPSAAADQAAAAKLARPAKTAGITGKQARHPGARHAASQHVAVKHDTGKTASSAPGATGGTTTGGAPSGQHPAASAVPQGVKCDGPDTGPFLPANYKAIVGFLTSHGYTGIAATGIAGNIYMESMGNPESVGTGGGGLIGWTPLPPGYVTGNPVADLRFQLNAILTFNQLWAQYIPTLNAATSPAEAAYIYVTDFERAGIPALGNRQAAANAVAAACGI